MKQKNTAPAFQKNQRVELEITGLTAEGAGVGRAQEGGMAVFVPGVIPGERVLAHIVKPAKTYAWGKALEILRPSPDRVPPDCPHAGPCGGCVYRHMAYPRELAAKQLESVKDQFVRLTAEYDNYRKRTAKEKDSLYQDAKADTIREFLAVYDNLERAVSTEGDEDSPHKKGLEMIFHQYQEILKKLGVTEIEAQGAPFDPEKHNAVMHIDDENFGENVVSQVFQAGFLLGDKVIRHAIVQVAN